MPPGHERTHLIARLFLACTWGVGETSGESQSVRVLLGAGRSHLSLNVPLWAEGVKLIYNSHGQAFVGVSQEAVVSHSRVPGSQPPPRSGSVSKSSRPDSDCNLGADTQPVGCCCPSGCEDHGAGQPSQHQSGSF